MPATAAVCDSRTSSHLPHQFAYVRGGTAAFCAPLSAEDQIVQSSPESSPVKWHQAHTTWFFETFVLVPFLEGYQSFHPEFHWLFNSYYKSLGGEIPEKKLRASFSRPPLEEILCYRAHVDAAMQDLLRHPDVPEEVQRRTVLGLNHEQQHLELAFTDIRHALFTNPLQPAYREGYAPTAVEVQAPQQSWIPFEGGLVEVGYPLDTSDPLDFCFDNETPRHPVYLQPFALANRLTTCGEYLDFMNDNGYSRPELWLSEGWDALETENWQAPFYWQRFGSDPHGWRIFTLNGWVNLEDLLHTPVCNVSFFEADAFARWKGRRLPTEAEWEHAATASATTQRSLTAPSAERGVEADAHRSQYHAVSSDTACLLEGDHLHPGASSELGLTQMLGPCWQWTASPYIGYPGYAPLPGVLGEYNGKFMSSQIVLRGASCVTPASHVRTTYRNFFPPGTRWQFSGIRLAQAL